MQAADPGAMGRAAHFARLRVLDLDAFPLSSQQCRDAQTRGCRSRGRPARAVAGRRREPDAARPEALPGARCPARGQSPHVRAGGRPRDGQAALRAESPHAADPGVEREARGHVRVAARARPELPLLDGRPRRRRARRDALARRRRAQGLRRPDAVHARPALARVAAPVAGHQACDRPGDRRRVVLRREAHGAGLEVVLLPQRVARALGADRRPRSLQGPSHATAGPRRRALVPGRAASGRDLGRGPRSDRDRRLGGRSARDDRVRAAGRRPALHGPRERQLHGRDAPQTARRGHRPPGHDRGRRAGGAPAPSGAADPVDRRAHRRRLRACPASTG